MANTMRQAKHVFLVVFLFILIITIEALVMLNTSWVDADLSSPLAGFRNFQESVQQSLAPQTEH